MFKDIKEMGEIHGRGNNQYLLPLLRSNEDYLKSWIEGRFYQYRVDLGYNDGRLGKDIESIWESDPIYMSNYTIGVIADEEYTNGIDVKELAEIW